MTYDPKHDQDLNDVLDNPEWTAEDIAKAKRMDNIDPVLAANIRRDLAERDVPAMLPEARVMASKRKR